LILAATNHPEILDHALFRRFDDVIEYSLPSRELTVQVLQNKLASTKRSWKGWKRLAAQAHGMSYADISKAAEDAIKHSVITGQKELTERDVITALQERKAIRKK
jgi:AAA+ superfamily predicted ATPase